MSLDDLIKWAHSRHIPLQSCDKRDAQACRDAIIRWFTSRLELAQLGGRRGQ
jgi:hypothetical protein